MIYRDADGGGEFGGDLGGFQFSQREASPQPNLGVVLLRLAPDQGSELVRGPRRVRGGFRGAFQPPRLLLARLVEPGLDVERAAARRLPLLVEVLVGDDLVVLDHGALRCSSDCHVCGRGGGVQGSASGPTALLYVWASSLGPQRPERLQTRAK